MILTESLREYTDRFRAEWLGNPKAGLLAGVVVTPALIPEAIAFSIIAGVDPKVAPYASFSTALLAAIVGGWPGHGGEPYLPPRRTVPDRLRW